MDTPVHVKSPRHLSSLTTLLRVVWRRQSYMNVLYQLVAGPLGLLYFIVLVALFSLGVSTVVVGVGLLLLVLLLGVVWGLGRFERELAIWWLSIDIGPMPLPFVPSQRLWPRLLAVLRSRLTWTSLLFLLAKFVLGWAVSIIAIILVLLTALLITAPFPYLLALALGSTLDTSQTALLIVSPLITLFGVALGIATLYICDGLAWVWAQLARATLGMSDAELRLAEARTETARAQVQAAQAQVQAERAEQSRRELIVNVSHELRTPIASIRGHVESLLMTTESAETASTKAGQTTAQPPEELRSYLSIVAHETERLSALVDDLLALARADAGELRLDVQPTPIGEVVEEVYAALAQLARRERQVTLVRSVQPDLPLVLADRQRLAQVLLNLVRNSITYTPTGGLVSLSAERSDVSHAVLIVADTGIGIPPEDLQHIFERFYRTDESRARSSGGFGLGLAIVRDLVQAMGGTINVQSAVGEGSAFRVTLWLAPPQAAST